MESVSIFFNLLENVGFPIVVSLILLVRLERKLDEINQTLQKFVEINNKGESNND